MPVSILITPGDSMWWLVRPEFLAYVDEVVLDPAEHTRVEAERYESGYHATVWKRLEVLKDRGLVRQSPIKIDLDLQALQAAQTIEEILLDEELTVVFVADMVFAYLYWVQFNQQRLRLMPIEDDYALTVQSHLPVWIDDLSLLVQEGVKAFSLEPKILQQTARSILGRVWGLAEVGRHHDGLAFASLKQFEPFLKHVDRAAGVPLHSGRQRVVYRDYYPQGPEAGGAGESRDLPDARLALPRNLPVEPDLAFFSYRLSKQGFWEALSRIRDANRSARAALASLLEVGATLAQALADGRHDRAAASEYLRLAAEMDEFESRARSGSSYLRSAFYGLSIVPSAALSTILTCVARGSALPPAISRRPDAGGLQAQYAILESLLDLSRFRRVPHAKGVRRARGPSGRQFWRGEGEPLEM